MKVLSIIKKKVISIIFILFIILLVIFSNSTYLATKNGLKLWANNIVPSLFPFLVAVELINHTNVVYYLSLYFDKYMRPLFNLPGISAFPFIMGLLSGYPIGAKIVSDLYNNSACTKEEAERMLPFTNNSGPLFIIGTVGISFYSNSTFGIILLTTHILSSITVGIIFGFLSKQKKSTPKANHSYCISKHSDISLFELGEILSSSIANSIKVIITIGGFVTLFSVIITLLEKTKTIIILSTAVCKIINYDVSIINALITGLIEFTNGLSNLSNIHMKSISTNIILSSFLIGFGGISILLQVLSIVSKQHLSIKKYIIGKALQGLFSCFYTFLFLQIHIFNFDL